MAGSLRSFLYETDIEATTEGEYKWIVLNLDEGNSETLGMELYNDANASGKEFASEGPDYLRLEPRYLLLEGKNAAGTTIRRRWVCGNKSAALFNQGGTVVLSVFNGTSTVEAVTFRVTGTVGEKRTLALKSDTGLLDGDAD